MLVKLVAAKLIDWHSFYLLAVVTIIQYGTNFYFFNIENGKFMKKTCGLSSFFSMFE